MNTAIIWLLIGACCFLAYEALHWLLMRVWAIVRLVIYFTVYAGASRIFRALRGRRSR